MCSCMMYSPYALLYVLSLEAFSYLFADLLYAQCLFGLVQVYLFSPKFYFIYGRLCICSMFYSPVLFVDWLVGWLIGCLVGSSILRLCLCCIPRMFLLCVITPMVYCMCYSYYASVCLVPLLVCLHASCFPLFLYVSSLLCVFVFVSLLCVVVFCAPPMLRCMFYSFCYLYV